VAEITSSRARRDGSDLSAIPQSEAMVRGAPEHADLACQNKAERDTEREIVGQIFEREGRISETANWHDGERHPSWIVGPQPV
jgi:hypothetical protein